MMRWFRRLDCDRASEMLSSYLDGYLAPQDKTWLEGHLAGCPRCREDLAALRGTVSLLQGLPKAEPGRSFLIPPRPAPVPVPVPAGGWRALRLGTAVATVLLVAVITADVLGVVAGRSQPALTPRSAAPPSGTWVAEGGEGPATGLSGAAAPAGPAFAEGAGPLTPERAPAGRPGPAAMPAAPRAPEATGTPAPGPTGTPAPAQSAEKGLAPMSGVDDAAKAEPRPAEEFQYADSATTAGGAPAPPATESQATPVPVPSVVPRPATAGPVPEQQQRSGLVADVGDTTAVQPANALLRRTWRLQAGLVAVWLGLVALTGYFWRVRRRAARSVRR